MVAAVEHGEVGKMPALGGHTDLNVLHDPIQLLLFIGVFNELHRVAHAQLAPQTFLEQVSVVADYVVRAFKDSRRGAVILFEPDNFQAGIILTQLQQVFGTGAAPSVDRLIVVANRGEHAMIAHQ